MPVTRPVFAAWESLRVATIEGIQAVGKEVGSLEANKPETE